MNTEITACKGDSDYYAGYARALSDGAGVSGPTQYTQCARPMRGGVSLDVDAVPVVLSDGSLWMEGADVITAVHVLQEKVCNTPAPSTEQSYTGARRGPKPRQHHNKVQLWVDEFSRQDMGEALTPSMNTCPQWLQDIIVGACRLNGSANSNSKPVQAWMVLKVLTQCEYISTGILMEFFDYQYGERYIRQITACCISASASIERYFHRLADALAEATGRTVPDDFSPETLWGVIGLRNRPLTDAEGWAVEKITQTLRIQQGLDPHQPPHRTITMNGKQYRRIIEEGLHVGWQAEDGHWLTGPVPAALRKAA
ncbi:hypothetical protein [Aeromonas media]|uniref:hypothetical protein n=1 Tax=Aeromonas media TaxID=651 RepID=UPI0038D008F3